MARNLNCRWVFELRGTAHRKIRLLWRQFELREHGKVVSAVRRVEMFFANEWGGLGTTDDNHL